MKREGGCFARFFESDQIEHLRILRSGPQLSQSLYYFAARNRMVWNRLMVFGQARCYTAI
jgi:hypothetical protein